MPENKRETGSIAWMDLTVPDAEKIRDFYSRVVDWNPSEVSMGDYSDFNMNLPDSGQAVTGVCHARGVNADLPPVWLIYIIVENLDKSLDQVRQLGGKINTGPKSMGDHGRYAVIRDPAGAWSALFEPAK